MKKQSFFTQVTKYFNTHKNKAIPQTVNGIIPSVKGGVYVVNKFCTYWTKDSDILFSLVDKFGTDTVNTTETQSRLANVCDSFRTEEAKVHYTKRTVNIALLREALVFLDEKGHKEITIAVHSDPMNPLILGNKEGTEEVLLMGTRER